MKDAAYEKLDRLDKVYNKKEATFMTSGYCNPTTPITPTKDIEYHAEMTAICSLTKKEEEDTETLITKLNNTVDTYAKIQSGPFDIVGYSEFAKDNYELGFVTKGEYELSLLMEWQAEDKDQAIEIAEILNIEVSKLIGHETQFRIAKDIWGVCSEGWYVVIDCEFSLPC